MCCEVLGLTITVRCDDPDKMARIRPLLDRFPAATNAAFAYELEQINGAHVLRRNHRVIGTSPSWTTITDVLLTDINALAIDAFYGLAVHAGVVASGQNVIAFPAESGAGKSTLTAACLAAGFGYVSDEALCVDWSDGQVVSYPKPLSLSRSSLDLLGLSHAVDDDMGLDGKLLVSSEALGGGSLEAVLRLSDIVLPVRNGNSARLLPSPRSEGLAALLRMSFNHYKRPRSAFELATKLVSKSRVWTLEYSSPGPAAELLAATITG
jgi:hypothetical protein